MAPGRPRRAPPAGPARRARPPPRARRARRRAPEHDRRLTLVAYRVATYGTPLRTEPARSAGRYHTGAEASPTQYLCLHPLGPLAELVRGSDLRTADRVRHVRARTWALRVDLEGLPEVTFDDAGDFGVAAADLVADDRGRCQELATAVRDSVPGLVVPSAALPGTRNVVLVGPRVGSPYLLDPVGAVDVPASITAHDGRPTVSLLDVVCFRGDRHRALEAWARGERFELDEPEWELARETEHAAPAR